VVILIMEGEDGAVAEEGMTVTVPHRMTLTHFVVRVVPNYLKLVSPYYSRLAL